MPNTLHSKQKLQKGQAQNNRKIWQTLYNDDDGYSGSTQNGVKIHSKKFSPMKTGKRENGKTRQEAVPTG